MQELLDATELGYELLQMKKRSCLWVLTLLLLVCEKMTRKIIYAEDDPDIRKLLGLVIKSVADVQFVGVGTGEELVNEVRNGGYSLVLTDNDMPPGMTGLVAIKEIRKFDKGIPIFMYSGSDVRGLALQRGATGYIDKNGTKEVTETVQSYLKR